MCKLKGKSKSVPYTWHIQWEIRNTNNKHEIKITSKKMKYLGFHLTSKERNDSLKITKY